MGAGVVVLEDAAGLLLAVERNEEFPEVDVKGLGDLEPSVEGPLTAASFD